MSSSSIGASLMRNLIHKSLWISILTASATLVSVSSSSSETLKEELSGILENHPQIKAAEAGVFSAKEGIKSALAEYLPTIQATGNFGYERIDSPGRRSATDPNTSPFTTGQARNAKITVTQVIFNGFRNDANNETAEAGMIAAQHSAETSKQGILFEAISIYLEVMRNFKLFRLSSNNEETIRLQLELEDERVRRGAGIAVDVLQSKSTLQVAKERRVSFEGQLEDSISRYEQVFGHAPYPQNLVMPTPPLGLVPETVEEVIEIALSENPAILSASSQTSIANAAKRIAKADYFPTIDVTGEWNYEDDLSGTRGTRRDYKAKVNASWTIFNGFATRAGAAQAAFNHKATIDSGNFVKRKITEESRLAWSGLKTARERVSLLQNAVNIAAEVFEARKKLRDAGKETVINVLGAESELFNARINLVSAQHDARIAVYRLMVTMGRLTLENSTNLASLPKKNKISLLDKPTKTKTSINIKETTTNEKLTVKQKVTLPLAKHQNTGKKIKEINISQKTQILTEESQLFSTKNESGLTKVIKPIVAKSKKNNSNVLGSTQNQKIISVNEDENFARLWPYE